MEVAAYFVLAALALMLWILAQPVIGTTRTVGGWQREELSDDECPQAAVILCLRGIDPFLQDTLRHLFDLDYPNYVVRIVVDHRDDPAWDLVKQVINEQQPDNVQVETLQNRLGTCGLKNSSLLQVVERLDPSIEFIAFLDADAVPHRTWLRDLAAPLDNVRVAACSGQRWYMPDRVTIAALIRYVWNSGTVAARARHGAWGGSYAIKVKALHDVDLLNVWRKSIGDDVMVFPRLRKAGYETRFVPGVIIVNRESCTLGGMYRWMGRQNVLGRLYQSVWPVFLWHGIVSSAALMAAATLFVVALVLGHTFAAGLIAGGLTVYLLSVILLLVSMERAVRKIVRERKERVGWIGFTTLLKSLIAIPLTQFVYTAAMVRAARTRRVEWRGVCYHVDGPSQIQLLEYTPYQSADGAEADVSV